MDKVLPIVKQILDPVHANMKQLLPYGASIIKPVVPHMTKLMVCQHSSLHIFAITTFSCFDAVCGK